MTTIRLNAGAVVNFDGNVLEHFFGAESKRIHVGAIHDLKIETDRKGMHWLNINTNPEPDDVVPGAQSILFTDALADPINALVAEIHQAMSTFRADNE